MKKCKYTKQYTAKGQYDPIVTPQNKKRSEEGAYAPKWKAEGRKDKETQLTPKGRHPL